MSNDKLQKFEDQPIRTVWNEEAEEWYFSVVDVCQVFSEHQIIGTPLLERLETQVEEQREVELLRKNRTVENKGFRRQAASD